MFELIYSIFFVMLIAEVVLFLFLTLPTPRGWKGSVVNFLNTNNSVQIIRRAHLGFCAIAALFLWDSINNSSKFRATKELAKEGDSLAAELKSSYYSYLNLKSQRNIYITAMLIYVSLALNIYVWILNYMYQKRAKHEEKIKEQQKAKVEAKKEEVTLGK